jgi:TonB family protein
VHAEDPIVPNTPGVTGGTVVVKVTIDELGRISEARVVEMALRGADFKLALLEPDLTAPLERSLSKLGAETASVVRQAAPALIDSALTSVRQWRFDSPAQGPLTFEVPVRFGAAPEIMAFSAAGTAPGGSAIKSSDNALRVGGAIKTPVKIRDVRPVYPPIAREAGVSGVVIIEAQIGADGSIEEARVLRSIPLLDEAALDAIKQWKFAPTLLNGKPVPIIMTMTVNFAPEEHR